MRAFWHMVQHARHLEMAKEIPPRLHQRLTFDTAAARAVIEEADITSGSFLTEVQSKKVLLAYGIPATATHVAATPEAAMAHAEQLGYPLALKILSPDISHKTEADGVQLDLRDADEVRRAYARIMEGARRYKSDAVIEGVAVQTYVARSDYELLIGLKRDAHFGPVILFGMGGIFTEVIHDRNLGLPPLNRLLIRRLMEETRVYRLLHGFRKRPPVDMPALEEILLRLSQLAVDMPEIDELDMNPVIVKDGAPVAVDARIRISSPPRPAPLHLSISPYPAHYERRRTTAAGPELLIRPIQPEDAHLFSELFTRLSPTSIYYRYFRYVKTPTEEMLARFTQIDYDRETTLVAIDDAASPGRMLGVANIVTDPDGRRGEFAILIGDPCVGRREICDRPSRDLRPD